MNKIDNIIKILEYINESPDKDKILDDLRMTDTSEFTPLLNSMRSNNWIDLDNDDHAWYRDDEVESCGYVSESDYDDKLDEIRGHVTDLIDTVNSTTMLETAKSEILKDIKKIEEVL